MPRARDGGVDASPRHGFDERHRLGAVEPVQLDPEGVPAGERLGDVCEGPGRFGVATAGRHDGERQVVRRDGRKVSQRSQGRLVRPVQVVEDDEDGAAPGRAENGPRDPVPGLERQLARPQRRRPAPR